MAASGYTISGKDAGNYALKQPTGLTANITGAGRLTVTLEGEARRTYDGKKEAPLTHLTYKLNGVVGSKAVEVDASNAKAEYEDKTAGTGKKVTVSGLALKGADAGNYALQATEVSANIGTIDKAPLPITDVTVADRSMTGLWLRR